MDRTYETVYFVGLPGVPRVNPWGKFSAEGVAEARETCGASLLAGARGETSPLPEYSYARCEPLIFHSKIYL
jgi:hypothetical protein